VEEAQAPDMLEVIEISADVRRAIRQLPRRQRQVVELRYLYEFSVAETAQILGMAEGTVGPTTKAALDKLKRIIEDHGGRWEETQ
jgi:RNA polymerase sigma factor (sigma-70 family)